MTHPAYIVEVATRLASTCPCNWTASDRNALIAYLAPLLPTVPGDLPIRIVANGPQWQLVRQP
jgi:hypothetical protein